MTRLQIVILTFIALLECFAFAIGCWAHGVYFAPRSSSSIHSSPSYAETSFGYECTFCYTSNCISVISVTASSGFPFRFLEASYIRNANSDTQICDGIQVLKPPDPHWIQDRTTTDVPGSFGGTYAYPHYLYGVVPFSVRPVALGLNLVILAAINYILFVCLNKTNKFLRNRRLLRGIVHGTCSTCGYPLRLDNFPVVCSECGCNHSAAG